MRRLLAGVVALLALAGSPAAAAAPSAPPPAPASSTDSSAAPGEEPPPFRVDAPTAAEAPPFRHVDASTTPRTPTDAPAAAPAPPPRPGPKATSDAPRRARAKERAAGRGRRGGKPGLKSIRRERSQYKTIFDPVSGARRTVFRQHRFLPIMMVTSDPAFGAIVMFRARYVNRLPTSTFNRIQLDVGFRLSTRLIQDHDIRLQLRDILGRKEVMLFSVSANSDPTYPYFGVADASFIPSSHHRDPRYANFVRTFAGSLSYAEPFWSLPANHRMPLGLLRWFAGAFFAVDRIDTDPKSLLAEERPEDLGLHRRGHVIGGVSWDRRDNEYQPTTGAYHDASFALAGPWMGSSVTWGHFNATARWYRALGTPKLIFAQLAAIDALIGKPPLIPLGEIGGLETVEAIGSRFVGRGIYRRRFIGDSKALVLTELRYQPFELPVFRWTAGLGARAFIDVAKVFRGNEPLHAGFHVSGGGGFFLVWDRFLILRFDAGFSREGYGVYIAGEHPF